MATSWRQQAGSLPGLAASKLPVITSPVQNSFPALPPAAMPGLPITPASVQNRLPALPPALMPGLSINIPGPNLNVILPAQIQGMPLNALGRRKLQGLYPNPASGPKELSQ
jgi:hypothetical protein